jgi:hypothetical protein
MCKQTNGWNGANLSSAGWCSRCLKAFDDGEMRSYHGPCGIHVTLCSDCADRISAEDGFYGCGCGG